MIKYKGPLSAAQADTAEVDGWMDGWLVVVSSIKEQPKRELGVGDKRKDT